MTTELTVKRIISAAALQVPAVQELRKEDMGRWGQRQEECGQHVG